MKQSGMTLIETLIAMAIMALLMLMGTYAYQFIQDNWERNKKDFEIQFEHYKTWQLAQHSIMNTGPKIVRTEDGSTGFYFLGRENGFTGYTVSSVQRPWLPAIYRLFRERTGDTAAPWQLVYEEAVLESTLLVNGSQTLPFNYRKVIIKAENIIEFEYFGWESEQARTNATSVFEGELAKPTWFDSFDGLERKQHPLVVQVVIDDFLYPFVIADTSQQLTKELSPDEI